MNYTIEFSDEISDFNHTVTVTTKNNGMVESVGKLTIQDLIEALNNSIQEVGDDMYETPILPQNTLKFIWRNMRKQIAEVFIEVPSGQFDAKLFEREYKQVGFPRMIFNYTVTGNSVRLSKILAVKNDGKLITHDTPLYQFPYPHVSTDGSVCMGGNAFPKIKDYRQLATFHMLFIGSPFSGDYGAKTMLNLPISEVFPQAENKPFNDDWLMPHFKRAIGSDKKIQFTFGEFMKFQVK